MTWSRRLVRTAHAVERPFDAARRRLVWRLHPSRPLSIAGYRGYGNGEVVRAWGRVLIDKGVGTQGPSDPLWKNVVNTWRRLASDEVPGARVALRLGERTVEATSDEEGYFSFLLPAPSGLGAGWYEMPIEIVAVPAGLAGRARRGGTRLRVLTPPADARFAVASDLDDTVLETGVTSKLVLARNVFLRNAYSRVPFPGVVAFYRALAGRAVDGTGNPLFYVSASPWNLYDLVAHFLALQGLPEGPLLLRDLGLDASGLVLRSTAEHKLSHLARLLATYPGLSWILIGDSTELDPEIYAELIRRHPGRVLAVYLREVTGPHPLRRRKVAEIAEEIEALGTPFLHLADTVSAAIHAAEHGWIRGEEVDWVRQDRRLEEARPTPTEAAVGGGGDA
ncbi:MAG TPA: phosphatase domain-containing protein [Thermoanaerobaculia bacterium]|nr:phosphatase domain-containing protein [Thermoanaerobaculia bacterium]